MGNLLVTEDLFPNNTSLLANVLAKGNTEIVCADILLFIKILLKNLENVELLTYICKFRRQYRRTCSVSVTMILPYN